MIASTRIPGTVNILGPNRVVGGDAPNLRDHDPALVVRGKHHFHGAEKRALILEAQISALAGRRGPNDCNIG